MDIVEIQKTSRKRAKRPRVSKRRRTISTQVKVKPKVRITSEIKTFDYTYSDTTPYELPLFTSITGDEDFLTADATGGMTCVNMVQTGASLSSRIGAKITVKSIRIRATITCVTASTNSIRIVLLCDKQPNGAFPVIGTIFKDNISDTTTFNSSLNSSQFSRFIVLRDLVYNFTNGNNLGKYISKMIKKKIPISYGSSNGDIGDLNTNSILLLAGTSTYTHTTDAMHIKFSTRLRYYDF